MRAEGDWDEVVSFLERESPDVLAIQETRLVAQGAVGCKRDDRKPREQAVLNRGSDAAAKKDHRLVTSKVDCAHAIFVNCSRLSFVQIACNGATVSCLLEPAPRQALCW